MFNSVHASGTDNQEMKDLQGMMKSDLAPAEKMLVLLLTWYSC